MRAICNKTGISRSTIWQAIDHGLIQASAYQSGDTWLIDTAHEDFTRWLEAHWQQAVVIGKRRDQIRREQADREWLKTHKNFSDEIEDIGEIA